MQGRGYRDAAILSDTVWKHDDETVNVKLKVYEGPKYYFGNVKMVW
jgi:outer membrane protein insertion porin family